MMRGLMWFLTTLACFGMYMWGMHVGQMSMVCQ